MSLSEASSATLSSNASSILCGVSSIFWSPTSLIIFFCRPITPFMDSSANLSASRRYSSETKCDPASTMMIEPSLPETSRSRLLSLSCFIEGLHVSLPSTVPILAAAMGPLNGMSDMPSAMDAPMVAAISGSCSASIDITVAMICVS